MLFLTSYFTSHKRLYNAVGFAVRCDRDTVALTCIRIMRSDLPEFSVKYLRYLLAFYLSRCVAKIRAQTAQISFKKGSARCYPIRLKNSNKSPEKRPKCRHYFKAVPSLSQLPSLPSTCIGKTFARHGVTAVPAFFTHKELPSLLSLFLSYSSFAEK